MPSTILETRGWGLSNIRKNPTGIRALETRRCSALHCRSLFSALQAQAEQRRNDTRAPLQMQRRRSKKKGFRLDRLEEFLDGASFTMYEFLMRVCGNRKALVEARRIRDHISNNGHGGDRFLANLLIQMYGKCGITEDARAVFDQIADRNVFSWTLMIAAYAENGQDRKALELFRQMDLHGEAADRVTLICILGVCSNLGNLAEGKAIHGRIIAGGFDKDVVAATALVNMYAKCGRIGRARVLFERMPEKNIVSWNAMIAAYAQEGHLLKALELFRKMDLEGIKPDEMSFSGLLAVLAFRGCLAEGRTAHARIIACGYESVLAVGNPLVNLYGKCGCLDEARSLFDRMPRKDVVSWNTMIGAYASHGLATEALDLFNQMGIEPDWITFGGVLQACSHAGLVDQGWHYLLSMRTKHGISPRREHYSCMIELLGSAGRLDEAEQLIARMPYPAADLEAWRSLLGACRIHGDVERAARVAKLLVELQPGDSGPYMLLANMYAATGRLDDLAEIRRLIKEAPPRRSSIQMEQDTLQLENKQIRNKLQILNKQMEELRASDR